MAHLLSLVKLNGRTFGPLIVSGPSPLLSQDLCCKEPWSDGAKRMYEAFGWTFPKLGRINDSRETWQSLDFEPRWSFDKLVQNFQSNTNLDLIRDGSY